MTRRFLLLGIASLASACGDDDCCSSLPEPDRVEVARAPVRFNLDVDVLFVVDDSPGALELQTNLKDALPALTRTLAAWDGGMPNLHIGVVTSDLGSQGALDPAPGPAIGNGPGSCAGTGRNGDLQTSGTTLVTGSFISDSRLDTGTRSVNYVGSLDSAIASLLSVGASGCGFEQPLEAVRRALSSNPANAGFLRPSANLAIINVSDEDDCSLAYSALLGPDTTTLGPLQSFRCTRFGVTCDVSGTTPDEMNEVGPKRGCHSNEASPYLTAVAPYAAFLRGLKPDPSYLYMASIAGPAEPVAVELRTPPGGGTPFPALAHSCRTDDPAAVQVADPAVRIAELAGQLERHTLASACGPDLTEPMQEIARQIRGMAGDACLMREIAQPADCVVFDVVGDVETPVPACSGTSTADCFRFVNDSNCPTTQQLRVVIDRSEPPAPYTLVSVRCML